MNHIDIDNVGNQCSDSTSGLKITRKISVI